MVKFTFPGELDGNFEYVLCILSTILSYVAFFLILYVLHMMPGSMDEYVLMMIILANLKPVNILRERDHYIGRRYVMNNEPRLTRAIYCSAEWLQSTLFAWSRVKFVKIIAPMTLNELFNSVCIWLCFLVVLYILNFDRVIFVLLQIMYVLLLSQMRARPIRAEDDDYMTGRIVKLRDYFQLSPFY